MKSQYTQCLKVPLSWNDGTMADAYVTVDFEMVARQLGNKARKNKAKRSRLKVGVEVSLANIHQGGAR